MSTFASRTAALLVLPLLLLATTTGCGPESVRRPLSGTVSFQRQEVSEGTITFLASGTPGGPLCGAIVRDGRFDVPAEQGLEPGVYRVSISWPGPPAPRTPEEIEAGASARASDKIPPRFNAATTLTAEVQKTGKNEFTFDLE